MTRPHLFVLLYGLLLTLVPPASAEPDELTDAIEALASRHLAIVTARVGGTLLDQDPLTLRGLEASKALIHEATRLDPENVAIWRRAIEIAALVEDEAMRREAVAAVSKLDPGDERVALDRLSLAIETRYQTYEERVEAYQWLVRQEEISKPIRSRLALDLALLLQRNDDLDAFGEALARALETPTRLGPWELPAEFAATG